MPTPCERESIMQYLSKCVTIQSYLALESCDEEHNSVVQYNENLHSEVAVRIMRRSCRADKFRL